MPIIKPEPTLLSFLDLDPRAFFILDLDAKAFVYMNPAFSSFFQVKPAGLKLDRVQKMINKEDRARVEKAVCALETGKLQMQEIGLKLPDGSDCIVEAYVTAGKQDDARLLSGYLKDITEERQKAAVEREKRAAWELKRRTLRHDLAGTLGFIPTFTHLILKKSESLEDPQIPVLLSSIESISKETLAKVKEYMTEEVS